MAKSRAKAPAAAENCPARRYGGSVPLAQSLSLAVFVSLLLFNVVCAATASDEEQRLKGLTIKQLSDIVSDKTKDNTTRWYATSELARRKEPSSKPLLITLLDDGDGDVRGAAAWGLCQIGGKDAQDALLAFLRTSLESGNWGDLPRATEAQKELPDKRALDLLIQCLNVTTKKGWTPDFKGYAAEALGKIGDSKASLALAQQLDMSIDYSMSIDCLYLAAIRETKGKEATPILIDYLDRLVAKMVGEDLQKYRVFCGREARQVLYDFEVFALTVSTLESVTRRTSSQGSREEVAHDWKEWWKKRTSEQGDEGNAP